MDGDCWALPVLLEVYGWSSPQYKTDLANTLNLDNGGKSFGQSVGRLTRAAQHSPNFLFENAQLGCALPAASSIRRTEKGQLLRAPALSHQDVNIFELQLRDILNYVILSRSFKLEV